MVTLIFGLGAWLSLINVLSAPPDQGYRPTRIEPEGKSIMTAPARPAPLVVGGADTHADTVHVAAITTLGREISDREFPTTAAGYQAAVAFLTSHGPIDQVGIEGTSSYGAGLARAVIEAGLQVIEVNRPNRADRRRQGKSDPLDAYQAARAVLSGRATSDPKDQSTEAIRSLHNTRRSAVKSSTAATNQITAMLITAPEPIRAKYRALKGQPLIKALARCRTTVRRPGRCRRADRAQGAGPPAPVPHHPGRGVVHPDRRSGGLSGEHRRAVVRSCQEWPVPEPRLPGYIGGVPL